MHQARIRDPLCCPSAGAFVTVAVHFSHGRSYAAMIFADRRVCDVRWDSLFTLRTSRSVPLCPGRHSPHHHDGEGTSAQVGPAENSRRASDTARRSVPVPVPGTPAKTDLHLGQVPGSQHIHAEGAGGRSACHPHATVVARLAGQPASRAFSAELLVPGNFEGGGLQPASSSVSAVTIVRETILFIFTSTRCRYRIEVLAVIWRASATTIGIIYRR